MMLARGSAGKLEVEASQTAGQEHLAAESSTAPPAAATLVFKGKQGICFVNPVFPSIAAPFYLPLHLQEISWWSGGNFSPRRPSLTPTRSLGTLLSCGFSESHPQHCSQPLCVQEPCQHWLALC